VSYGAYDTNGTFGVCLSVRCPCRYEGLRRMGKSQKAGGSVIKEGMVKKWDESSEKREEIRHGRS